MVDRMPPAHVVIFSELTPRARVQYTRFLVDQRVTVRSVFGLHQLTLMDA